MPVPDSYTPNDLLPESRFLRASDYKKGQKWLLTISDVSIETLGEDTRKKLILSFEGKDKGHVLNASRRLFLETALGDRPNQWIGAKITLAVSEALFQGKTVPSFVIVSATPAGPVDREPGDDDL